jgi:8-oxo-dGTP pyrophosphatase MutT (NUDIX family)
MTVETGSGPVVVMRSGRGELVVLPHVKEPVKKWERWVLSQPEMSEVADYEFPGGAMEKGEGMPEAATRELLEEAGLFVSAGRLREIGVGGRLNQQRGLRNIDFGIELYELQLNLLEEIWVRLVKGGKTIDQIDESRMRPRDKGILRLLEEIYTQDGKGEM